MAGHRQAHRHLAVLLLAKLPAVLPRHADRVAAARVGWMFTRAAAAYNAVRVPKLLAGMAQQRP